MLTFDQVWSRVGKPSREGSLYTRQYETATLYAWEDDWSGESGWSWAIAVAGSVVSHGWTAGGRVDRDHELSAAIERIKRAVAQPRGAA